MPARHSQGRLGLLADFPAFRGMERCEEVHLGSRLGLKSLLTLVDGKECLVHILANCFCESVALFISI